MPKIKPLRPFDRLERYRIEEPIDDVADREQWQDIAARDVFGADYQRDHAIATPDRTAQSSADGI
jgi:hypothetical protein